MRRPGGAAWGTALRDGRLVAGVVAIGIAAATRKVLLTIAAGFAALWIAS